MNDLQSQLLALYPEKEAILKKENSANATDFWIQEDALVCKYIKKNGKTATLIEGYQGAKDDFESLAKLIKKKLSVGGSIKNDVILLQGNFRDEIMEILKSFGFKVKRVGG